MVDSSTLKATTTDVEEVLGDDAATVSVGIIDVAIEQAHAVMKRRVHPHVITQEEVDDEDEDFDEPTDQADVTLAEALLAAHLAVSQPDESSSGPLSRVSQESAELEFDTAPEAIDETDYLKRAILVDPTGALGGTSVTMTVI